MENRQFFSVVKGRFFSGTGVCRNVGPEEMVS